MRRVWIEVGLAVLTLVVFLIGVTAWGWPAWLGGLLMFWGPSIGLAIKKRREAREDDQSQPH